MNFKRITALMLVLLMCVTLFSACGEKNSVVENSDSDTDITALAEVNGIEVTEDIYRYFLYQASIAEAYSQNPAFAGDFSAVDWSAKTESGKTLEEAVSDRAINDAIEYTLLASLAIDRGLEATAEDMGQIDTTIEQVKTERGEEMLLKTFKTMGVSSVEGYRELSKIMIAYSNIEADFNQDKSKYIEDEKQLQSFMDSERVSAQHILITNDSETHANPEEVIKDVLKRAKGGEDFNALMEEFNEDPGEPPVGYSFGRGEMVPEFENAAFALGYGEISDVVASDYGYHIIKRVVGLCEYKNYLEENADIVVNSSLLNSISVKDTMTEIYNITKELNEMSGGEING